jgi:hypothetical protein
MGALIVRPESRATSVSTPPSPVVTLLPPLQPEGDRRCLDCSGDIDGCMAPTRQGVLSFNPTCPAALVCTRSRARAEHGHRLAAACPAGR